MATEPASAPAIDWGATGDDAALQAQAWMLATPVGTTPLSRAVGIDYSIIGAGNDQVGRARLSAEIAQQYRIQFLAIRLVSISYLAGSDPAVLQPSVITEPKT